METGSLNILTLDSLEIGFSRGRKPVRLLPPLKAAAAGGELVAVIGRNGIGKSTLLRTLAGLQPQLGGDLYLEGRDIREYSRKELATKAGYVSTEIIRVSNMTVYDLAAQGRFPHTNWYGMIDSGNHAAVMDSISKAGMSAFAGRILTELSDGERQRAMIAMVLAQDADLMIMDEPTAFLDIRSRFEIFNLLRDLTRKRGKTIVFSTHDFDAAVSRADKIWLMLGDGLEEGAPEDLILSGNAGRLFDETEVLFNPHNGTFMTAGEKKGAISVTGAGDKRYWTEKAVIRSGYTISDKDFYARLFVPDENNSLWRLDDGNHSNSFDNLYSLSSWLRNNPPLFP